MNRRSPPARVDIRCDSQLGASAGCVNTVYPGIVTYSLSNPVNGQAVAGYAFAQYNLPDAWGTEGHELTADRADADLNRGKICGKFVADTSLNTNDSCDEFPFASTAHTGTLTGLTFDDCAEVYPFQDSGSWYIQEIRYTGAEHCEVAHVKSVRQQLSRHRTQQRLAATAGPRRRPVPG